MAIESVSSISPVINRPVQASRPPETTPNAVESASQENDARRTAAASTSASPSYVVGPQDTETTLQSSAAQISRAYAGGEPTPSDMRAASEAYRTEASAQDQLAGQQQGNGARTVDVMV